MSRTYPTKTHKGRYIERVMRIREKELLATKTLAETYMEDKARVFELLRKFKDWFSSHGEMLQCTIMQLEKSFEREYVFDILNSCGSPLGDVEHYVLYEIITHYGDRTFSFTNILDLMESIKYGRVQTVDLNIGLIESNSVAVFISAINGSIPYNPLNMHLMMDNETTVRQLIRYVKSEFNWPSREIQIYQAADCDQALEENVKLKDLKVEKNEEISEGIELFVDYSMGYIDNPLILSDHYFEDRTVDKALEGS
ncbi:hypothetical protein EGR_01008 [Echinococcus granulosus]|uniref:Uncharacterized protein n=1 Tax=Echinococcus granulosus TaxID=6210 RepID=W6UQB0_ECHGR|nr:hypothetical protein EGR_01008 [Echinococcus granulosus]EUB63880.1 hypothetical protein EGR_01008 [Echinococcus granulosus]